MLTAKIHEWKKKRGLRKAGKAKEKQQQQLQQQQEENKQIMCNQTVSGNNLNIFYFVLCEEDD